MNGYLVFVIALIVFDYVSSVVVDVLNLRHLKPSLPEEFSGWYDDEKYRKSQEYLRETTRFDIAHETILIPILLGFILLGGFLWVDALARAAGMELMGTGLAFAGILVLGAQLVHLPFDGYFTFVIEEKFGFNKTTRKTFAIDFLKSLILTAIIGGLAFSAVLWFFSTAGRWAWVYCWIALILFQLFLIYIAPVVILPLFNKFTPLDDGELKDKITAYAQEQGFALKGIFTMDGSKRSTKSNAYFTGFGRWRRIVLYDTLIEKHTVDELVAVLAHEVGHYKLKHINKQLAISILSTGLMLFILSLFITRPGLYAAFQVSMDPVGGHPPMYAGLVFFGFLYAPISMILSIAHNMLSRKFEFEADAFAAKTHGQPDAMIEALKKLSVDNLSNLTPHPLKVFLEYSHPPVLHRIAALRGT